MVNRALAEPLFLHNETRYFEFSEVLNHGFFGGAHLAAYRCNRRPGAILTVVHVGVEVQAYCFGSKR